MENDAVGVVGAGNLARRPWTEDFPIVGEEFPMRQMIPVGLALVGMALAAPAAATAGSPDTRPGLFARKARRTPPPQVVETMPTVQPASAVHVHTDGVRCPICEAAAAAPPVVMMGACSACENGSTTVHNHPMIVEGEAPGLASLGPAEAPGYARLGGATNATPVYAEPTPIGVMQAGYQPAMQPQGMQGGPVDVLALSEAREKAKRQAGPIAPTVGGMPGKPRHRPHILAHLFGFEGVFQIGREREARRQSQHAAIAYGAVNQPVTDVPASAVYSQGGH